MRRIFSISVILFFFSTLSLFAQNTGKITGTVVDGQNGEPLIGANVYLEGLTLGAATDMDGNYVILGVPAGTYELVVMMVGYAEMRIQNTEVKAGELTKLDLSLQSELLETDVVKVEARVIKDSEGSLLRMRQKAVAVSDAISAEEISKSGSGDAAAAMKKVTGASVVGGKYVYIRGLGERYSATTLNGAELPSADPDKKSFQLDLIPSNMLDNINTIKTFTPDKPGTFTGGLVDVSLKSYPEQLTFQVNSSVGYNSITTGNDNFILSNGGDTDWLGFDDGTRDIPGSLKNSSGDVQVSRGMSVEEALNIDKIARSFNNSMVPVSANAPVNSSFGISLGNSVFLDSDNKQSIGYFGSLTWGQNYSFIDNGETGRYKLVGGFNDAEALVPEFTGNDTRGSREINWGSIANIAYKNPAVGQFKFSYMHTQSAEAMGRSLIGFRATDRTAPGSTKNFETSTVSWIERSLNTFQLDGEHQFGFLNGAILDWKLAQSTNKQLEPDQRYFFNVSIPQQDSSIIYQFDGANGLPISRYYRDLEEDNFSTQLNFGIPFKQWAGLQSKLKIGFASTDVNRNYNQRRFDYVKQGTWSLDNYNNGSYLNTDSLFSAVGIYDSTVSRVDRWFGSSSGGNFIVDEAIDSSYYFSGDMKTTAYYAMLDLPLFERLRFIGGARVEDTEMNSQTENSLDEKGHLKNTDVLPSVNFVYSLQENMNLRAAYSQTVARPTFRELAPYENFEFVGDFIFKGNANLKRTLIKNYDLRWEWFLNPGEIIAISGFYKDFNNPIERKFIRGSGDDYKISVENVEQGRVYGLEVEARKSLAFITENLSDFKIGTNLSLVHAEVDVPENDLLLKVQAGDSTASKTRSFPGQSPYIFNLNLTYDHYYSNTSVGFFYNIFGDRLSITGRDGTPDIFERGFSTLDFKASKGLTENISLSFAAKNLLNPAQEFSYRLKNDLVNKEFIYQSYKRGISYSLSLSYKL